MIDLQGERIAGSLDIDKVGVRSIRYPIVVKDKLEKKQATIGTFNMYVSLPKDFRGTHMSRFLEVLQEIGVKKVNRKRIRMILLEMKKRLAAKSAHIEIFFPYFIRKTAPVSRMSGLNEYQCALFGSDDEEDIFRLILEVNATVLTLCPCSKELSPNASAHNQRNLVKVRLRSGPLIWIEDIIEIIESSASSPIYPILKRVDEKYVMDHAHEKPRFVEDIVREIAQKMDALHGIHWFSVSCESYESIHNHNAYALIEKGNTESGLQ